jgi:hypothetical protein
MKWYVRHCVPFLRSLANPPTQYLYQAKIGVYNDTPIPNPDLVALGVKFGTVEEFIQKEVVPRFA